ncbi:MULTISPECIES: ABC transporter substrate-binding protein [unclassified Arthrobacter]|uniref:ABC transporter substrate-binding protein n=1 Tax=unclassified Arthrobacter TaxID=235627 RepID=UPI003391CA12
MIFTLRARNLLPGIAAAALALAGCAAPPAAQPGFTGWDQVTAAAQGQTVRLWMYGGDEQGNSYVDNTLKPAAAKEGVTLKRVPVADTKDAMNLFLTEVQAGTRNGAVDLVWVNGDNFGIGKQAGAWSCGWTSMLPNMTLTAASDPLLANDFGTPVEGCEAPWSKAQFTFAYNSATVTDPPKTLAGLLDWSRTHPGRFTYPAPPDFTGSVFTRQVLYSVSGGYAKVPLGFDRKAFDTLTPALSDTLTGLAPSLWREGKTYPKTSAELNALYAGGQVDFTMTYGPGVLVIRQESISIQDNTRSSAEHGVPGIVTDIPVLGPRRLVTVDASGITLQAEAPWGRPLGAGDAVRLTIPLSARALVPGQPDPRGPTTGDTATAVMTTGRT